jgi:SAM-dependent methyltransferase
MTDSDGKDRIPAPGGTGVGFDEAYLGTPPWDIGRPQPALLELADRGLFRGHVLDVGCGTGEHALLAAERGLPASGIDLSPRAIDLAKNKAAARNLAVEFRIWDALDLGALGVQFDTVIDSGLYHVFDDEQRESYVASLGATTAVGGRLLLMCFSDRMPGDWGPRRVTRDELEASFAANWSVESIEEAHLSVNIAPESAIAWRGVLRRTTS